jgi:hypothetical protein
MLLEIRAKAAAAEGVTGSVTEQGAGSASGSSNLGLPSGSALPAGAAGMPRMPGAGTGDYSGSRSSQQQLPPTGDALPGQGSGSCGVSSSSTPVHSSVRMQGPAVGANTPSADGVLAVDVSEKVEALLERFERVAWSLKHNGRKLGTLVGATKGLGCRCWHVETIVSDSQGLCLQSRRFDRVLLLK